jgi:hypothetical protein
MRANGRLADISDLIERGILVRDAEGRAQHQLAYAA